MVYSMMPARMFAASMLEQGIPPHWTSYIAVAEVDAGAEKVTAAGGTILMPPMDVFDSGRMSMVQDSTGAMVGLWQPREHIGAELIYETGALGWNELNTNDTDAAAEFYASVFGWSAATSPMGPEAEDYTEFKAGDDFGRAE